MAHQQLTRLGAELTSRSVVPVLSKDAKEAKHHVKRVYKQFQRVALQIRWDQEMRDIPLPTFRLAIKNEFVKNAHLTDIRVIDRLVMETEKHLESFRMQYYNPTHTRDYFFRENVEPKATDFLSKFLSGKE